MTLFIDMDGVLADFFSLFARDNKVSHWKEINDLEKALFQIRGTDFFNRVEAFEGAATLISFARETKDWGICSTPLRGDRANSIHWKRIWLERHNFMPKSDKCIFTSCKHKYAVDLVTETPNILVDDKLENIIRWENSGGVGLRFQANEESYVSLIRRLEKLVNYKD
jgi:hypothetical protein